jgi:hypothetical protein
MRHKQSLASSIALLVSYLFEAHSIQSMVSYHEALSWVYIKTLTSTHGDV